MIKPIRFVLATFPLGLLLLAVESGGHFRPAGRLTFGKVPPTFGSEFGSSLGKGIGRELQRFAENELQKMELRRQQAREQQAYESIGLPGVIAQFDPEIQCELVKQYMQMPGQPAFGIAIGYISQGYGVPEDIFVQLSPEQIFELEKLRLHRQYLIEQNKQLSPGFWYKVKKGWTSFCSKVKNGFKKLFSRKKSRSAKT